MNITPASVGPGQSISVTVGYPGPKAGFVAIMPGSAGSTFQVELPTGAIDWPSFMTARGMLSSVAFQTGAGGSATVTLTAPQQPGSYQVQTIVPSDGGTLETAAFTVEAHGTPATGGTSPGTPTTPAGSGFSLTGTLSIGGLKVPYWVPLAAIAYMLMGRH